MPDLDYNYEVTIQTPATSDPAATSVTNQWQRQLPGNASWEVISGANGETYKIAGGDRSAKIRLQQDLDGVKVYSNELQVTSDEFDKSDGINFWGDLGVGSKWSGSVLALDGMIYAMPSSSYDILKIDPINRTHEFFGDPWSGAFKYSGGVLARNGKIYGIPSHEERVLEIDPTNGTYSFFGSLSSGGSAKWHGGVVGSNGKIYGIPNSATQVLEINPTQRSVRKFGPATGDFTYSSKWYGGVLAPNGKIFGIPHDSKKVLIINPSTGSTKLIGNIYGSMKWNGGVLAPNGKIIGIPYFNDNVLEIDPVTEQISYWGQVPGRYSSGVLAPNGKIYAISNSGDPKNILEIDPIAKQVNTFGDLSALRSDAYYGAVLTPSGKIISAPFKAESILEIDLGLPAATGNPSAENWTLSGLPGDILDPRSAYFNKL